MTPKASAIPTLRGLDPATRNVVGPLVEVVETLTGRRPKVPKLAPLPENATLAETIDKVNEIIDRLNV